CQRSRLYILSVKEAQRPATLPDADDYFLFALRMPDFVLMAALPSADEGLIYLNRSAERLRIYGLHCIPDAMAEIPCCAVVDAQHPFKLIRRHTLARLANQERCKEPLN